MNSERFSVKKIIPRSLSPLNIWALSFGGIIGWGSFIMPGTMFLPNAGPLGTVIAMSLGGVVMLLIGANFCYVANRHLDNGGIFAYTRNILGHDHAFLAAWSLGLAYLALIWANATAFSLLIRYLFGDALQWGFHYQVAGYNVFFGEVLFTMLILIVFWALSSFGGKIVWKLHSAFALALILSVLGLFVAISQQTGIDAVFNPAFQPNLPVGMQIFSMLMLAPWMFVGYEAVTHAVENFNFPVKKLYPIVVVAVFSGVLVYSLLTCLAVLSIPPGYASWTDYVADLQNLSGFYSLPVFHSVWSRLGMTGVGFLGLAVISALSTSLLGFYRAAAYLIQAMSNDALLPARFAQTDERGVPKNALLLIVSVSLLAPLLGRTSISWLTDVTTIAASIAYGYISFCGFVTADNRLMKFVGAAGILVSIFFFFCPILPNLLLGSALTIESYTLLAVWSIGGFIYYWYVFKNDQTARFGKSTAMCIMILFLAFFSTNMWIRQVTEDLMLAMLASENDIVAATLTKHSLIQMGLMIIILYLMSNIFTTMRKREKNLTMKIIQAEESSRAKTTFLFNMSHDIRTPMNAIIGYIELSKKVDLDREPEKLREFMNKIDAASQQLLSLINDVLEMSRIESGKMELAEAPTDLLKVINNARDIFETQMQSKGINFSTDASTIENRFVLCDEKRLSRVLLNLLSNAYKFTPEGGSVDVTLTQKNKSDTERCDYELRVRDTGIGMSEEFAKKIFEAFERERTSTVSGIQGTGLGMAITKKFIDLMSGTIEVVTEQGKGTEFIVWLSFVASEEIDQGATDAPSDQSDRAEGERQRRILLVDDIEVNREIAKMLLEDAGFAVDIAVNGKEALDTIKASARGEYDVILMDIQMPVMDGYEAARAIRALEDEELASIPIIAMTANAFDEDKKNAADAGMNGHVAKPIDVANLFATLENVLNDRKK